jgi:hypothetical protein
VKRFIEEAYVTLSERLEPLSLEEGNKLSMEDVIAVNEIRHRIRVYSSIASSQEIKTVVSGVIARLSKSTAPIIDTPGKNSANLETRASTQTTKPAENVDYDSISGLIEDLLDSTNETHTKKVIKAGIQALIRPYCTSPPTIERIFDLIAQQVTWASSVDSCSELVGLVEMVLRMLDKNLMFEAPLQGSSLPISEWLFLYATKSSSAGTQDWVFFDRGTVSDYASIQAKTTNWTTFLGKLVDSELVGGEIFVSVWEKILRTSRDGDESWVARFAVFFELTGALYLLRDSCRSFINNFYLNLSIVKVDFDQKRQVGTVREDLLDGLGSLMASIEYYQKARCQ